ncbi:hypothetical protein [Polaromonas glacialis]|nr:hypothetical protein [Polaromonas glacialis]
MKITAVDKIYSGPAGLMLEVLTFVLQRDYISDATSCIGYFLEEPDA